MRYLRYLRYFIAGPAEERFDDDPHPRRDRTGRGRALRLPDHHHAGGPGRDAWPPRRPCARLPGPGGRCRGRGRGTDAAARRRRRRPVPAGDRRRGPRVGSGGCRRGPADVLHGQRGDVPALARPGAAGAGVRRGLAAGGHLVRRLLRVPVPPLRRPGPHVRPVRSYRA
ncbi:hypothetical protein E0504_21590 [Parafrankia sp. BMG5.11]|nr:hypothetical protein E0504_21590 [Parafrankia sp. BMG5.11]